jgi:hypothetical protein
MLALDHAQVHVGSLLKVEQALDLVTIDVLGVQQPLRDQHMDLRRIGALHD